MRSLIAETVVLVVAASAIGLVANTVGPRAIKLSRDYFPKAPPRPQADSPTSAKSGPTTNPPDANAPSAGDTVATDDPPDVPVSTLEHTLQPADSDRVLQWFEEMPTSSGLVVFVDARPDSEYEEGHIPGALHVDHYQQDAYWPAVEDRVRAARVVIVYCAGGDCEDSIFLSNDLIYQYGIPYENVFLYEGGIKDWTANARPVKEGSEP